MSLIRLVYAQRNNRIKKPFVKRSFNLTIKRIKFQQLKPLSIAPINHINLPSKIDLRDKFPPAFDQGELGSCTANALCGILAYNISNFMGSRLFLYYNERKLENDLQDDSDTLLHDGITCLQNYGICLENDWEYDLNNFAIKPPESCYISALNHKAINVTNIYNDITHMKTSLVNGFPFVVGISIYSSFESYNVINSGIVPMPTKYDKLLGGHAVLCCGYDDSKQVWIMRNSWGVNWGDHGYFYLPYLYLLDSSLATDLWNIVKIN